MKDQANFGSIAEKREKERQSDSHSSSLFRILISTFVRNKVVCSVLFFFCSLTLARSLQMIFLSLSFSFSTPWPLLVAILYTEES